MLGKTERRIALVILVTSILPLAAAVLLANLMLDNASSVWLRPDVDQQLERGIDLYKDYVRIVKEDMKHQTDAMVGDEALRDAARKRDAAGTAAAIDALFPRSPRLASLTVEEGLHLVDGDDGLIIAARDRGRPFDETTERRLPVRRALGPQGTGPTLVATFAVAFALEAVWLIAFGTNGVPADPLGSLNGIAIHGSLSLRWVTIVEVLAGVILLGGTGLFLSRSNIGLQMRAAASDFRTARLLGVKADSVISLAFVIAGVMAAVVALLFTVQQPLVTPTFGLDITIIALVGAVVGGVENLWSATAGGFAIGFATSVLNDVLPASQQRFQTAWVFLLVIILLLVRPAGLFVARSRTTVERV